LPPTAFTATDVLGLYLHRGAFEIVLSDEDQEQDPDRWVSHSPPGQEFWQILSQWMWNLRLELGHRLHPTPARLTEMAAAHALVPKPEQGSHEQGEERASTGGNASRPEPIEEPESQPATPLLYGAPQFAPTPRAGRFAATDFQLQTDGTLRCPAHHTLYAAARRPEPHGTVRLLYAARLPDCRGCPMRHQCQGEQTQGPRHVSAVLRPLEGPSPPPERTMPLPAPTQPLLWGDWSRCRTRRDLVRLLRTQTVTITAAAGVFSASQDRSVPLTRAERAHWRLSWTQRLSRNASKPTHPMVSIRLFGIPTAFATSVGLAVA
jgi:hypothetical protein